MLDLSTDLRDAHLHLIQFCLDLSLKRILLLNRIILGSLYCFLRFLNNFVTRHRSIRRSNWDNNEDVEQPDSHRSPQPSGMMFHSNPSIPLMYISCWSITSACRKVTVHGP